MIIKVLYLEPTTILYVHRCFILWNYVCTNRNISKMKKKTSYCTYTNATFLCSGIIVLYHYNADYMSCVIVTSH